MPATASLVLALYRQDYTGREHRLAATIVLHQAARDLDFATTNGSVIVEVPASLNAELDMSTTNGHVSTDFPMTLTGRIDPRRMRATIGNGDRRMRLHTTNGNVELRKAP